MRLSRYFMPILKENPKEAEIVSHRLMLRAGMIRQQSAGIYSWLPLGKRLLEGLIVLVGSGEHRLEPHFACHTWANGPVQVFKDNFDFHQSAGGIDDR